MIIIANAYFILSWGRCVLPILIVTVRERLAALRKYTFKTETVQNITKVSRPPTPIEEITPSSHHPAETFEALSTPSYGRTPAIKNNDISLRNLSQSVPTFGLSRTAAVRPRTLLSGLYS